MKTKGKLIKQSAKTERYTAAAMRKMADFYLGSTKYHMLHQAADTEEEVVRLRGLLSECLTAIEGREPTDSWCFAVNCGDCAKEDDGSVGKKCFACKERKLIRKIREALDGDKRK